MNADTPSERGERRQRRRDAGFTLIEVLIAATLTVVAFAGLATMQMLALRAADSTLQRTQATALAYQIVERMRLNRGATDVVGATALGGGYDNRTLCDSTARRADDTWRTCAIGSADAVSGSDNVSLDLHQWWESLHASGLPNWYARIQREGTAVLVSVQWDDSRGETAETVAANTGSKHATCLDQMKGVNIQMPASMQEVCVTAQL